MTKVTDSLPLTWGMRRIRPAWGLVLLVCLGTVAVRPPAARAAEIWLAGVDPFVRNVMRTGEPSDYLDLFKDGAPWPRAAAKIQVFKTSTQYLLNAPDEALRQMFEGLRRRGIALGFEGLMIPRRESCGQGVEGYSAPGAIRAAAERTRLLGGVIDAVAMDEPLWYGHHDHGAHTCASAIDAVAREVAENVAALRAVFPQARVGDIEPLDMAASAAWVDEIGQFATAFAAATGTKLDFFDADLDWNGDWRPALTALVRKLRAEKIAFGLIYNGDPEDDTDEAWTAHATARFETVEATPDLMPDRAILQTWMVHPRHVLPETQPGTMTGLVLSYLRPASHLALTVARGVATGRLTGADGKPIAGARILLTADDAAPVPRLTPRHLSGIVPERAAKALLALRLNTECGCTASALVTVGPAAWSAGGRAAVTVTLRTAAAPDEAVTFRVVPGSAVMANGATFEVVPGTAFDLSIPLGADREATRAGYLALIFLDTAGVEMQRHKVALTPSEWTGIVPATDSAGAFSATLPSDISWVVWRGDFPGNTEWRGVNAIPIPKPDEPEPIGL